MNYKNNMLPRSRTVSPDGDEQPSSSTVLRSVGIDSRRSGKESEGEETSKRARRWRGRQPAIEGLCQGQRPVHEDLIRAGKPSREQDDVDGGSEVAQGRHPRDFNAPEGDSSADGLRKLDPPQGRPPLPYPMMAAIVRKSW